MGLPSISDWPNFASLPNYKPNLPRFTKKPLETFFNNINQSTLKILTQCLEMNPSF